MSWKNRYKIYKTSDPNLLITAVCSFPNIYDTIEKVNEYYDIEKIQNSELYKEIYAYYNLVHSGRDFIPVAFADRIPKLNNLQRVNPLGKGYFWCVGYVSKSLIGGASSINKHAKSITTPNFETLLSWLKYHSENISNSTSSNVNRALFNDALRKYIIENNPAKLDGSRRFDLIYNCNTIADINRDLTTADWVAHLEGLKNRNLYEIIVNDFK